MKVLPVTRTRTPRPIRPGPGIQQWRLAVPLRFRVKALVPPGQAYTGDLAVGAKLSAASTARNRSRT